MNTDDGSNNPSHYYNKIDSKVSSENINKSISNNYDDQFNALIAQPNGHVLSQVTIDKIKMVLDQMSDKEVAHYLSKAFPLDNFSSIQNKKQFSERLLEELSSEASISKEDMQGKITLSRNLSNNLQSENMSQIYKNQQIVAHYDTLGKLSKSDQVFVKWINKDSGEVLLFTPQPVNPQSDQNWVSFTPPDGWKPGEYAIQYYQVNDKLTPIAQADYTIGQVLD
ncbi:hypothetical protein ACKER8_15580 [Acinetobacter baumannii]|uniref:hypothetical protein n=1 Tax=Acinetobacter baumannii TaxID=470 RepID=UPI0038B4A99A